jgi:hypothetical protein
MAAKKGTRGKKALKRGKKVGAVKSLKGIRRLPGGIVELNPQPLPP